MKQSITAAQGAAWASLFLGAMIVWLLCLCGLLPAAVGHALYALTLAAWYYVLFRGVWEKMRAGQRFLFGVWANLVGFALVFPLTASLLDPARPALERLLLQIDAVLIWDISIAIVYNFLYKNKPKMRKKIVAGNWKMNTTPVEGAQLAREVVAGKGTVCPCVGFIVCPPFTHLSEVVKITRGSGIGVGAQNCAAEAKGAYTGEVSAEMIASLGVEYVILGHSERREYYGETSSTLNRKMEQAYANNLTPIYCVGEKLEEREAGKHFDVVSAQIEEVVYGLSEAQFARLVVAYEPVWAIGTGKTATAEQAQQMHAHIRKVLAAKFGALAQQTPILYGGSCKPSNAAEIFSKEDVDGGLIGGAALKAEDFLAIGKGFGA